MHTWNTTKAVSTNKLDQATAVLEVLQSPFNLSILGHLQKNGKAQLLDLALHLHASADELEYQLDRLCRNKLVKRQENVLDIVYILNESKLHKVMQHARTLARFYVE